VVVGHGVHSLGLLPRTKCSDELEEERARKRTSAVVQESLKEKEGTAAMATATSFDAGTAIPQQCNARIRYKCRNWRNDSGSP
jgi:hypothetical protein